MKLVRFEFECSRDIPFYAHLCNRFLTRYPDLTVARTATGYVLEQEDDQAGLERLAEEIAGEFPLSVWLTDSRILVAAERLGTRQPLPISGQFQDYCSHCHPRFGDNQSPQFGQLALPCPVCQGETHWLDTQDNTAALLQTLLGGDSVTVGGAVLSLKARDDSQSLLICNPNMLNPLFQLSAEQTLALSAIEKPAVLGRNKSPDESLPLARYRLCFPWNRELIVLCERLRQRGITWLALVCLEGEMQRPLVARIAGKWSPLTEPRPTPFSPAPEPLHDSVQLAGWQANWRKKVISFSPAPRGAQDADTLAHCALNAINLEHGMKTLVLDSAPNTAALHFTGDCEGKLVHTDNQGQVQTFLTLPSLPTRGAEVLSQLMAGEQAEVTTKFAARWPEVIARVEQFNSGAFAGTLTGLLALCALLLDLDKNGRGLRTMDHRQLADALEACAMEIPGRRAPRIDYPLIKNDSGLTIDWKRTLGSLMAFRLVEPEDAGKIAFGVFDSLADYLANWIEHLDNKFGICAVGLCGDEMAFECLAQRLAIRIGKNYPLLANHKLPLVGANYAAGALYLKRRRFAARSAE
ncbi:hypothetical protein [Shewanella sp. GXUN23E]|uniref:hypothetical protein n=1 Tax=Shewanella sp. GXUN23E TaxID=3422498 RepID=UPI003D7D80F2